MQLYHPSPNWSSGFAQLRLHSENAIYEPADDAHRAEGYLEQTQHDHVPLVKDEISIAIHSALIHTEILTCGDWKAAPWPSSEGENSFS